MKISIPFGNETVVARVPDGTEPLRMRDTEPLPNVGKMIQEALDKPIGAESLLSIARRRHENRVGGCRGERQRPKACVVVSDNTRPVPYREPGGILMPILKTVLAAGFEARDICLLIATGTHRAMAADEIAAMLGPEILSLGIETVNHDSMDPSGLVALGSTHRGTKAEIDRRYVEADLKILTGLVESHFMAGASGGRKAICPGIMGEEGTYIFHSASLMSDPRSRDLNIEGNPVHEEALEAARMAGADFIANVTVDRSFRITGLFFGSLEAAHEAAVAALKRQVVIPFDRPYDLLITHGGFVALNHYQAAKAAVASMDAVADGGKVLLVANNHDVNPVGSDRYRIVLGLLKLVGPAALERMLASPDWRFIPEQWQVQMWAKVFKKVGMGGLVYFAPQLTDGDWRDLPGVNGRDYLPPRQHSPSMAEEVSLVIENCVSCFLSERGAGERDVGKDGCRIAFLEDGPYGIPRAESPEERA